MLKTTSPIISIGARTWIGSPMKVCLVSGCPTLTTGRYCTMHAKVTDQARGSRQDRGYGKEHTDLRAKWAPLVATGIVQCWRCLLVIPADAPWDLGHRDDDRSVYAGPEHRRCNRATAGRRK